MLHERWRAAVPVVSAVAVVAALSLLTVTIMGSVGTEDERAFVDADGSTTTTTAATRRVAPRPTTTTTAAPEVLGETTERDADDVAGSDAPAPTTSPAPAPPSPTAAPAPAPTPAPTTTAAPPTTASCRNSTDPACGEFSWDPQPGPYEVEVYAVSTPIAATAGEPVTFAVDHVDPAGPDAQGACLNWWVSDPAVVNTSSCEVIATSCARTGPHDPPEPSRERIPLERTITFETPGEHEVRIEGNIGTHLADGCESPYRNSFTRTFTITVS